MSEISNFPVIMNERILLRQLSIDDKNEIFELRSETLVNRYLDRAPCLTVEDAQSFIHTINEYIKNGNALYWAITVPPSNSVVGTICLFDFSTEKNTCEIGYELQVKHHGKGIMKDAIRLVIDHAFQMLKVEKIFAASHCQNHPSTRLLLLSGFVPCTPHETEKSELEFYVLYRI